MYSGHKSLTRYMTCNYIFSHSMGCLFTFLMVLFDPQVFSLDEVQFICFPFVACAFVDNQVIGKSNFIEFLP